MSNSIPNFAKLNNRNYATWKDQMATWGPKQGCWRIISGDVMEPDHSDVDAYQKWLECANKRAGEIYLGIEENQKHHLGGVLDSSKKIWELLEEETNQRNLVYALTSTMTCSLSKNRRMKVSKDLSQVSLKRFKLSKTFDLHAHSHARILTFSRQLANTTAIYICSQTQQGETL